MGILPNPLGSESGEVAPISDEVSPIPDSIISAVETEHEEALAESSHTLRALANSVQRYIWSTEYANRPGNAFFEQLAHEFNQPSSLREPIRVEDNVLFANILAEGWADIASNTTISGRSGLTAAETKAVRDAHARFAEQYGLGGYTHNANVCVIKFRNEGRLEEFIQLVGLDHEQVNRKAEE
jgi:hypothetical protein